jgi:hypothetical protein
LVVVFAEPLPRVERLDVVARVERPDVFADIFVERPVLDAAALRVVARPLDLRAFADLLLVRRVVAGIALRVRRVVMLPRVRELDLFAVLDFIP